MSKKLQLTITTPLDIVYQGQVDQVTVSTESGEITILSNHVPLISRLRIGHVLIKEAGKETYFAIEGGLIDVKEDNRVIVLSDRSEQADAIDVERAEEAAKKAAEYMKNPAETGMDYAKLQSLMSKEQNRAKIARRGGRK